MYILKKSFKNCNALQKKPELHYVNTGTRIDIQWEKKSKIRASQVAINQKTCISNCFWEKKSKI